MKILKLLSIGLTAALLSVNFASASTPPGENCGDVEVTQSQHQITPVACDPCCWTSNIESYDPKNPNRIKMVQISQLPKKEQGPIFWKCRKECKQYIVDFLKTDRVEHPDHYDLGSYYGTLPTVTATKDHRLVVVGPKKTSPKPKPTNFGPTPKPSPAPLRGKMGDDAGDADASPSEGG